MIKAMFIGGASSGKSRLALELGNLCNKNRYFIATCVPQDTEMIKKVEQHRKERGNIWHTIEEPINIEKALTNIADSNSILLIDCLSIWLSNLIIKQWPDIKIVNTIEKLAKTIKSKEGGVILVSQEVGLGIVPDNPLARRFRALNGKMNQILAEGVNHLFLVIAGECLTIKGEGYHELKEHLRGNQGTR